MNSIQDDMLKGRGLCSPDNYQDEDATQVVSSESTVNFTDVGQKPSLSSLISSEEYRILRNKGIYFTSKYGVDYTRELGRGTDTVVRQCYERKTGRTYAVKSCLKSKAEEVEQLKKEALRLLAVQNAVDDHSNILKIYETFEDYKYYRVILELCDCGKSLFDGVNAKSKSRKFYSERDAASIVGQILRAVASCHKQGIVHRNLTLESILFANKKKSDIEIKIIDFSQSVKHDAESDPPITSFAGTGHYVAPEVLNNSYNNRCDVWAIGVITYYLLSGRAPFGGITEMDIFDEIQSEQEIEFPARDWNGISEQAIDFIKTLLRKDPSLRPSAEELVHHDWIQRLSMAKPPTKLQKFKGALHKIKSRKTATQ